jgi:hypothetical protein
LNAVEVTSDGAPGADAAAQDYREEAAAAEAAAEAARKAQEASSTAATAGAINPEATAEVKGIAAGAEAKSV